MGKLYITGAGPGDPELLTVRAHRVLQAADVILYDRLVSPAVLAIANSRAKLICVGKHEGDQERLQNEIFRLVLHYGRQPKTVVRLKGGDPMVFGRGAEEWAFAAEHGIETEIIPGISSAVSVPALAGIPLTYRGIAASFAVVSGHCVGGVNTEWDRYANAGTLVILMGVKHRTLIASSLIAAGKPAQTPAAFVESGTTPKERVVITTLAEIAAGSVQVEAPAVLVVGEVVSLRGHIVLNLCEPAVAA